MCWAEYYAAQNTCIIQKGTLEVNSYSFCMDGNCEREYKMHTRILFEEPLRLYYAQRHKTYFNVYIFSTHFSTSLHFFYSVFIYVLKNHFVYKSFLWIVANKRFDCCTAREKETKMQFTMKNVEKVVRRSACIITISLHHDHIIQPFCTFDEFCYCYEDEVSFGIIAKKKTTIKSGQEFSLLKWQIAFWIRR